MPIDLSRKPETEPMMEAPEPATEPPAVGKNPRAEEQPAAAPAVAEPTTAEELAGISLG